MELLQVLITGLGQGCLYGLIALGFVLIYKATEIVNFAQGDLLMLGAFFAVTYVGILGLPFWLAFLLTIASMAVFGYLLDMLVIRSMIGESQFSVIILTISIHLAARLSISDLKNTSVLMNRYCSRFRMENGFLQPGRKKFSDTNKIKFRHLSPS